MGTNMGRSLELLDFKQLQWPGHGVGDMQPFQYLDREYMKAEEYDDFLFDPTGFYLHTYLPRVAGAFEGLDKLPDFPRPALLPHWSTASGPSRCRRCAPRSRDRRRGRGDQPLLRHHVDWVQRSGPQASR
jgi:hypothetical protein